MSDYKLMDPDRVEAQLCRRLAELRLGRDLTQAALAAEAGVSARTIRRLEAGEGISLATLIRVMQALSIVDRLDTLIPGSNVQPILRVQGAMQVRERASGKRKKQDPSTGSWKWGDE